MGFYIQTPEPKNKARQLKELFGAADIGLPPKTLAAIPKGHTLICVICNDLFDAAGIVFDDNELEAFKNDGTDRKRTWMTLRTERVAELVPHIAAELRGEKPWRKPRQ